MAIVIQCDGGCGATTDEEDEFQSFGIIKKVWYCDNCAPSLEALYDLRDSVHTQHAKTIKEELMAGLSAFKSMLPKAKLPDAKKQ